MDLEAVVPKAKAKKTKVAAKLTTVAGNVYYGVNVESSCHSLSICAERSAVFAAVTAEGPGMMVASIEVLAVKEDQVIDILPCGGCRQVLGEFSNTDTLILGKPLDYWLPHPYR